MIIGSYPCCNGDLHISMPETAGFSRENCPHCGSVVWHRLSRFEPSSWTEADFLEAYEVDEKSKKVVDKRERDAKALFDAMPPELRKIVETTTDKVVKMASDELIDILMYGDRSANRKPVGLEIMHKNMKTELSG